MYLKITEPPLYQLQIACGFVRRAGEAQQHKLLFCCSYSKSYNWYTHCQAVKYSIGLYLSCLDGIKVPQQLCQVSWEVLNSYILSCDMMKDKIQGEHWGTVGIDGLYLNLEHKPIEYLTAWQCWYISYDSCCSCSKIITYVAVGLLKQFCCL